MTAADEHTKSFDLVFVGAGLSSALSALSAFEKSPALRIALIERDANIGGNHTWCFHAADIPAQARSMVEPLIVKRWPGYQVRFPRRTRRLASPYACISSERLAEVTHARFARQPGSALLFDEAAQVIAHDRVILESGRVIRGQLVIDARGPELEREHDAQRGYQKFVGLELEVVGHGVREPILFDACLPQHDGFRFMYVLPLSADRLLIEETFFSDRPELDRERSRDEVLSYAAQQGFHVVAVLREEHGVLPMPWHAHSFDPSARPLRAGYRAGLFHPVTGYSIPLAVRFALALSAPDRSEALATFARNEAAQRPFLNLLTRLLFMAFAPERRFSVLEHFYRLPEPLIERFYAAQLTHLDRARMFWGPPPRGFSLGRALGLGSGVSP